MKESRQILSFPEKWKLVRLNQILERITERNGIGEDNVLTISAQLGLVSQEIFFNKIVASENSSNYFLLNNGDFAYNKSYSKGYPFGVIRRLENYKTGIVSPLYICFRPTDNLCSSDFLLHYFEAGILNPGLSLIAKEGSRNHGLLNVGVNDFFGLSIQIPGLAEQKKIAEILNTIDRTIAKTEALIEKYQQIKAGLMHDLFTRGIGADGKLRSRREEAPELYQETAIGWIPKEWEALRLKNILEDSGGHLQTGPFGSQLHAHEYTFEGVPFIMPQNINDGKIDERAIARILETRAQSLYRHRLKIGDIIIARRGELRRAAAISEIEQGWVCGSGCFILRLGGSNLDARFFSYVYRNEIVQTQVVGLAVGSTMPSLNNDIMGKLIFPYMSKTEQTAISDKVELTEAKITSLNLELAKFIKQKSGLMHDLLTGKVSVDVDSAP